MSATGASQHRDFLRWTPRIKQERVDVRRIDINQIERLFACNMDRLNAADMRLKACEPYGFRRLSMRDDLHSGWICHSDMG
jgi:hypothetical protein